MKLYTDSTGKFQMYIPIDWEYKNPSLYHNNDGNQPQAFGLYGSLLGAFQISCKPVTEHIAQLINKRNEPIQSSSSTKLFFSELKTEYPKTEMYMFSSAVDDHYFFATYTISNKDESQIEKYADELLKVREVLSTIKFVKPEFREKVIANRRYDLFMASMAATIDLMNKAIKNESFIEYVALSANQIDALLRLSIILTEQLENKNDEINTLYLFQSESDKAIIMERSIYKIALEKEIISQDIFERLETLYKERNKVIHRFIITDIRTEDILNISVKFHNVSIVIDSIVNTLEQKQLELKIGTHKNNLDLGKKPDEELLNRIISGIRDKHGEVSTGTILGTEINKTTTN